MSKSILPIVILVVAALFGGIFILNKDNFQ